MAAEARILNLEMNLSVAAGFIVVPQGDEGTWFSVSSLYDCSNNWMTGTRMVGARRGVTKKIRIPVQKSI